MQDEIETEEIIKDIFQQGKTCFIPRYQFQSSHMDMVKLASPEEISSLPKTSWNIHQPGEGEVREEALITGPSSCVSFCFSQSQFYISGLSPSPHLNYPYPSDSLWSPVLAALVLSPFNMVSTLLKLHLWAVCDHKRHSHRLFFQDQPCEVGTVCGCFLAPEEVEDAQEG
ncbi:methenyltetrahydrofolate synthetase [Phyllostomus discolor]|uniref:5-formyltetrahydrofolate cyclo-ligase n=1 Tax=Phyllostomus discolor TaxID=89673 RepID=A0A833YQP1_9CHIR|nr:methenyltetrahydrofolate synthetase [Phyllostomus discolor]